jgi:hypothetical protein
LSSSAVPATVRAAAAFTADPVRSGELLEAEATGEANIVAAAIEAETTDARIRFEPFIFIVILLGDGP